MFSRDKRLNGLGNTAGVDISKTNKDKSICLVFMTTNKQALHFTCLSVCNLYLSTLTFTRCVHIMWPKRTFSHIKLGQFIAMNCFFRFL